MVIYKCFRCGYTNKIKSSFIKHLNRKFICKPLLEDIEIEKIYNNYFKKQKKVGSPKVTKMTPKVTKMTPKRTKLHQNAPTYQKNVDDLFICNHCNTVFKHRRSMTRHIKNNRCKIKNEKDQYKYFKELINLLNIQLKEKDKIISKKDKIISKNEKRIDELMIKVGVNIGTQNNIQNNIQTNIKVLAYNKSDLSHLQDKDYINFLNHSNFCIPHMIKKIHFDKKKPENHNIYISNIKNNYIMIYDGIKWDLRDRNEIINDMIENNTSILEDKLEDWIERGENYPEIMKKFNRYLEKKENNTVLNKIKNEIKLILFNNRKIISYEK